MDYEPDFALVTDNNEVLTSLRPEKEEKDEYFEEKPDVVISLNSSQPSATSQEMHNVSFSNFKPILMHLISILYLFFQFQTNSDASDFYIESSKNFIRTIYTYYCISNTVSSRFKKDFGSGQKVS